MVRMRMTKGKRNERRSHHKTALPTQTNEGETPRLRHHASRKTGLYRGKSVLTVREKKKDTGEGQGGEKQTVENVEMPVT